MVSIDLVFARSGNREEGGKGSLKEGKTTRVCLSSSFILLYTKCVRYFMAIWCNCFMSFFISFGGILRCFSACIDCSCKV